MRGASGRFFIISSRPGSDKQGPPRAGGFAIARSTAHGRQSWTWDEIRPSVGLLAGGNGGW